MSNKESDILSSIKTFTNRFEKIWSTSLLSAVHHVQRAAIYASVLRWSLSCQQTSYVFLVLADVRYLLRTNAASRQIGPFFSLL